MQAINIRLLLRSKHMVFYAKATNICRSVPNNFPTILKIFIFCWKVAKDEAENLIIALRRAGLVCNAFAATPSDESLERLYQVQKMDALLDQTFQSVEGIVLSDPKVQDFLKNAPEDKRPQLEAVLKKIYNSMDCCN